MEDLLTSNVFGLWRYLSPDMGLLQFLGTARNLGEQQLQLATPITEAKLNFWPWLHEPNAKGAEPDVLISLLGSEGQNCLVLIESKYLSGKSSQPNEEDLPNDQLAKEMLNLRSIAERSSADAYALVYVTAHGAIPSKDIEEAADELKEKTGDGSIEQFYWTTWRRLPQILDDVVHLARNSVEKGLIDDLATILNSLGLTFFQGFDSQGWNLGYPQWCFVQSPASFSWLPILLPTYVFCPAEVAFLWILRESKPVETWRWRFGQ